MKTTQVRPLSLVLGIFVLSSFALEHSASAKVRAGDRAAAFVAVQDGSGKSVSLAKYSKRVVVLTFGASWCKPCGKELPAYEKLAKSYDSKKVVFLAVNIDSSLAKGKAFMAKAGVSTMIALYDSKNSTVALYDPPTMPTTFVIKGGVVKEVHSGFRDADVAKVKSMIKKQL